VDLLKAGADDLSEASLSQSERLPSAAHARADVLIDARPRRGQGGGGAWKQISSLTPAI
jgi:hypothetical protein